MFSGNSISWKVLKVESVDRQQRQRQPHGVVQQPSSAKLNAFDNLLRMGLRGDYFLNYLPGAREML
jgi:hypothetical protein